MPEETELCYGWLSLPGGATRASLTYVCAHARDKQPGAGADSGFWGSATSLQDGVMLHRVLPWLWRLADEDAGRPDVPEALQQQLLEALECCPAAEDLQVCWVGGTPLGGMLVSGVPCR